MNEIVDNKMIDQIRSSAFPLEFKRDLPQNAREEEERR